MDKKNINYLILLLFIFFINIITLVIYSGNVISYFFLSTLNLIISFRIVLIKKYSFRANLLHIITPTIILFSFVYFWHEPLFDQGYLLTSEQRPEVTDSNYYLYLSNLISSNFSQNYHLANSTWLSQGVVFYGTFIFMLFGKSPIFISFFNSMLLTISISKFINSYKFYKVESLLFILVFLSPFAISYYSILSKELLSVVGLLWFFSNYNKSNKILNITLPFLFVFIARPNLAVLLFISVVIYNMRKNISFIIIFSLIGYLFLELFQNIIDNYSSISTILERNESALYNKQSSVKKFVYDLIIRDSLIGNVLMTPIRLLVWILSPLPLLDFSIISMFDNDFFTRFGARLDFARVISIIFTLYALIKITVNFKLIDKSFNIILVFLFISIALVSFNTFFEGARYKILFEPFIFFIASVTPSDKNKIVDIIFIASMLFVLFINILKNI